MIDKKGKKGTVSEHEVKLHDGTVATVTETETPGTVKPKPPETKRAKFVRLMKARMPKAEKAVSAVANLFRRGQYDCDQVALDGTVALMRGWIEQLEINFKGTARPATLAMPFLTDTAPPSNGPAQ